MSQDKTVNDRVMRHHLWESVGWEGVFYCNPIDRKTLPTLALSFESWSVGKMIFDGLRDFTGPVDKDELLRVVIMRNVDPENPHDYRISIGVDVDSVGFEKVYPDARFVSGVIEFRTMASEDSGKVDRFLKCYQRTKSYFLTFLVPDKNNPKSSRVYYDGEIIKTKIVVKTPEDVVPEGDIDKVLLGKTREDE